MPQKFNTTISLAQPGAIAPAAEGPSTSVQLAIVTARRWWKLAAPAGIILGVIGAGLVLYTFKPEYRAAAWLRVHASAPYIAFQGRDDTRLFVDNLKELIRSRLLLAAVVGKPAIEALPELRQAPDPIDELASRVSISAVGRSEYFAVGFRSLNPDNAALVANAVADAYISLQSTDERERRSNVLDLLEREREHHERTVSRLRSELENKTRSFAGEGTPPPPPRQGRDGPDENTLNDLQRRIVDVNVERAILNAELQAFKQQNPDIEEDVDVDAEMEEFVESHPEIRRIQTELDAVQARIHEYKSATNRSYDLTRDPDYQQLQGLVDEQIQQLDDLRETLRGRYLKDAQRQVEVQRRETAGAMASKLRSYEITYDVLHKQFLEELSKTKEQSGDSLQLEFLRAELDQATQVLNLVSERMLQLRTELRAPDRVVLVEKAVAPAVPVEQIPIKNMALAALAMFAAPFALAFAWEKLVGRVGAAQQLESQSQMRVVGEIVKLPWRRRRRAPMMHARDTSCLLYEESVDSLRTCLLLSEPLRGVQVLAVTSAVSQEGKTSLAAQYAVSIARATRQKVLLIDGDLRRPDVHRVFGIDNSPGLAEVLNGSVELEQAIATHWSEFLHLLPAGKMNGSPHRLMGNDAFKSVLNQARADYRHIVIDTPPVLAVGESLVLAKSADAAVLCAMRDVSRLNQVRTAYQRLVDAGAKPVGAVLGGVPPANYRFRYGGYHHEN